jgi:hypothetical protein
MFINELFLIVNLIYNVIELVAFLVILVIVFFFLVVLLLYKESK